MSSYQRVSVEDCEEEAQGAPSQKSSSPLAALLLATFLLIQAVFFYLYKPEVVYSLLGLSVQSAPHTWAPAAAVGLGLQGVHIGRRFGPQELGPAAANAGDDFALPEPEVTSSATSSSTSSSNSSSSASGTGESGTEEAEAPTGSVGEAGTNSDITAKGEGEDAEQAGGSNPEGSSNASSSSTTNSGSSSTSTDSNNNPSSDKPSTESGSSNSPSSGENSSNSPSSDRPSSNSPSTDTPSTDTPSSGGTNPSTESSRADNSASSDSASSDTKKSESSTTSSDGSSSASTDSSSTSSDSTSSASTNSESSTTSNEGSSSASTYSTADSSSTTSDISSASSDSTNSESSSTSSEGSSSASTESSSSSSSASTDSSSTTTSSGNSDGSSSDSSSASSSSGTETSADSSSSSHTFSPEEQKQDPGASQDAQPSTEKQGEQEQGHVAPPGDATCAGRRMYVYKSLPAAFDQVVTNCSAVCPQNKDKLCPNLEKDGLGHTFSIAEVRDYDGNVPEYKYKPWLPTEQHMLGLLFRTRTQHYDCLTENWEEADVFYIPALFGLLDVCTGLVSVDDAGDMLEAYLKDQPGFKRRGGMDHFIVEGQQIWSFARGTRDLSSGYGAYFLNRPALRNITFVSVEDMWWDGRTQSIPYPTAFHPSTIGEINEWVEFVKQHPREYTVSMAGGARSPDTIRAHVLHACEEKPDVCKMVDCRKDCPHNYCFDDKGFCADPRRVSTLLLSSKFCLQPSGDSYTRRAIFDSLLAGCIPVFFSRDSFHNQYHWNFPENRDDISVLFDEEKVKNGTVDFIEELKKVPEDRILEMRAKAIGLIPQFVFRDHTRVAGAAEWKDALDVALEGLLKHLQRRIASAA